MAFLTAVANLRRYDSQRHTGCNFLSAHQKYITKTARLELPIYGPLWYVVLDVLSPALGIYGKEIANVVDDDGVDRHMAKTFS